MLNELLNKIKQYNPLCDEQMIRKAYAFAETAHQGQLRNSGEAYFVHPVNVAFILTDLNTDDATIAAGLMHDILEDTLITYETMQQEFGPEVATLVDGVTKLKRIKYQSKQEKQAENLRKMVMAMANDIRVIIIKLADRLHNMRTLEYKTRKKQIEIATETIEIYAPLAHRLGINKIKWELEDLCLRYMDPDVYYELAEMVNKKRTERESYIEEIILELKNSLDGLVVSSEITGRPKSLYSIYKKMYHQNKTFDQIFDLTAIRVIVDSIKDCYAVLGTVHTMWKPLPGRFKDYIAMPKPNMYQSLHTTVIGPEGEIFEVQIRTRSMHRTAEYGIAAHWNYKEGKNRLNNFDQKLTWIRQLMDWQKETSDSTEFMENLKGDFFSDEVYVFSPKGDVIDLPTGSTPIDFAYRVHSAVGNNCVGAKIDGRIVPLNYKLKNGNIVEILTSSNSSGPSQDWLNIVKSTQAKTKIKQWFKKEQRDQNIVRGRDALEKEVRKEGYKFNEILKEEWLVNIAKKLSFNSINDMYASLGYGSIQLTQILPKLRELHKEYYKIETTLENLPTSLKDSSNTENISKGIIIKNVDNVQVKFAGCCNPVPGDDIIGYITKGRGISIHQITCVNIQNNTQPERLIEAYWDKSELTTYQVALEIIAFDKTGYVASVTHEISKAGYNLTSMNARANKDKTFTIDLTVEIKNTSEIELLIKSIRKLKDTIDVYRIKA